MYAKGDYSWEGVLSGSSTPTLPTLGRTECSPSQVTPQGSAGLSEVLQPGWRCFRPPLDPWAGGTPRRRPVRQPSLQWRIFRAGRWPSKSDAVRHPPLQLAVGSKPGRGTPSKGPGAFRQPIPPYNGEGLAVVSGSWNRGRIGPWYANSPYNGPQKGAKRAQIWVPSLQVRQLPLQQGVMVRRPPLLGTPTPILWRGFVRQPPLLGTPSPLH